MANEHFSPTAAIEYVKCNINIEDRTQTGFTQSSDVTSECFSGSVIARTQTADFVRGQCVNQRQFYNQILTAITNRRDSVSWKVELECVQGVRYFIYKT
jgi:hypothetical protein